MATIKPIEGKSVHQIQSGQVIVDLCSVVKELVENALDAHATSLEIRFKNSGLDLIEVADNGNGVAPQDFETIALKHYTSKLAKYDDLTSLSTFGFRGEALSSLCALSRMYIVTSREGEAPKGSRLEFEMSGKLKSTSVVASQKGTTVSVENIFQGLPVRRRELEKNIKREYRKVLDLLHAYACISTNVRFSVSNTPSKGQKQVAFHTKANATTKENIANVYGAKVLLNLVPLDLRLELHPTTISMQTARNWGTQGDTETKEVRLVGHISRPVVGEGRQTSDRQMFFVNSRPCTLPQVAKAMNEVYRGYNVTQSAFIFADLQLDTNAYDVNVSPDKRTILLHDQTALLEALKERLAELFDKHEQTVPQAATPSIKKLPSFKPLSVSRPSPIELSPQAPSDTSSPAEHDSLGSSTSILRRAVEGDDITPREDVTKAAIAAAAARWRNEERKTAGQAEVINDSSRPELGSHEERASPLTSRSSVVPGEARSTHVQTVASDSPVPQALRDFNARMGVHLSKERGLPTGDLASAEAAKYDDEVASGSQAMMGSEEKIASTASTPRRPDQGIVMTAFDRMRPKRTTQEMATVTIGNQTTSVVLGTPEAKKRRIHTPKLSGKGARDTSHLPGFVSSLKAFAAPGSRLDADQDDTDEEEMDEIEDDTPARPHQGTTSRNGSTPRALLTSSMTATTVTDTEQADDSRDPVREAAETSLFLAPEDGSDDEYMEEAEKKAREEARVARLIQAAEEKAARPNSDNVKRAASVLKGRMRKDSTLQLMQELETSVHRIDHLMSQLSRAMDKYTVELTGNNGTDEAENGTSAEERLSLTVSKADFGRMRIVGQFNLGFVLATRSENFRASNSATQTATSKANCDELFIIDQHASDEKYNFERLQAQTIVQNQRLVVPKQLDLTAIEEEIILNHPDALTKNGFEIEVDTTGETPVGQRCKVTSLPMSREVTFNLADLEELLALLAEHPESGAASVPRPSKVRRMFAMRACRSSIMVGKTLTKKQMASVVTHMGELDKPWNCPHGRPTMRHLFSLDGLKPWEEGQGISGIEDADHTKTDWAAFVRNGREAGLLPDTDEEDGEQEMEDDPAEWLFTQQKST